MVNNTGILVFKGFKHSHITLQFPKETKMLKLLAELLTVLHDVQGSLDYSFPLNEFLFITICQTSSWYTFNLVESSINNFLCINLIFDV